MQNPNLNEKDHSVRMIFFAFLTIFYSYFSIAQENHVVTVSNTAEYVQIQDYGEFMTNGNSYTVECLFKLNTLPTQNNFQAIFGSGDYFNPNFIRCAKPIVMVGNDNAVGTYFAFIPTERKNNNFGQLTILPIPHDLEIDKWYHVAIVYNGGREFYLYVDGRRIGHASKSHFNLNCGFQSNNMNIGGLDISGINYFPLNGSVDEFRIWKKAKTEREIQAEMYTHLKGDEEFLDVYFDFDDAATSGFNPRNVIDRTGNGNNAVASAFTTLNWSDSANFSSFIGTVNNDFSLPENWYNYQNSPLNVGIAGNAVISNDLTTNNLSIAQGASLTVTNSSTITLNKYAHAQGGFILEENASLVQLDEKIVNQYPITTERTGNSNEFRYNYWSLPAKKSVDFTYRIPPVVAPYTAIPTITETLLTPADVFNFGTGNGQRDPYWLFILTGTQGGFGNSTDNVFWSQIDQNFKLEPGFGFTLKGPLGSNPSNAKAFINGVPNNGDINVPLVYVDNNSYLIGNPYPSAISADEFITRNATTITGTLYFWEQWDGNSHAYDEYIGGYATYTKLGSVTTRNPAQSFNNNNTRGTISPNNSISVGQGFVVETRANNSANIIFDNDMRITGNNTQFYRPSQNNNASQQEKLYLNIYNEEGDFDQILIGTHPLATFGDDYGLDGKSLDTKEMYAYTMINDEKYTINALQNLARPIPLGVMTHRTSEHTIALASEEGLSNKKILLRDNVTRVTHDLTISEYIFELEIGDIQDRFELLIRPNATRNAETDEIPLITASNIQLQKKHNGIKIVSDRTIETLQVYDLNGQMMYTDSESDFIQKEFKQGFYVIVLTDQQQHVTRKKIFIN